MTKSLQTVNAHNQLLTEKLDSDRQFDTVKPAYVPFDSLGLEIINKIESLTGAILVVSDPGLLVAVLRRMKAEGKDLSAVSFVAHTPEDAARAKLFRVSNIIQIGYNELIQELEKKIMGLKFDVIVGNPPYGNLHLKILAICVKHLAKDGTCITIQPVRWLQDPLWEQKKTCDAQKMQQHLDGKIDKIDIVKSERATQIFNADFGMDLGIFEIREAGGSFDYASLSNQVQGIDISAFKRLIGRTERKPEKYSAQKHFVPLKLIAAAGSGRGFNGWSSLHTPYGYFTNSKSNQCKYGNGLSYDSATKANIRRTCGKLEGSAIKAFNSAIEAENFFKFITLEAFRFFVLITTLDVHIQYGYLPIPTESDSFKKIWTNEDFFEYFGITEEEQKVILDTMKLHPIPFV